MTSLFAEIEKLIPTLHGWCAVDKAQILAACVIALKPDVVLEVGVWGGRSLIPMAMALKYTGHGRVIGIDPWEPIESVKGQGGDDAKWWSEIPHDVAYKSFMDTVASLKLQFYVQVERHKSDDVDPPPVIDILHIDGNHGPQAETDSKRFAPKVRLGGLCCLDDLHWSGGAVRRGEEYLLSTGFVKLYELGTGAMYQRQGVL